MQQSKSESGGFGTSIGTIAFASAIGTTIEWYDFFLFGVVTPLVLNKLFFPNFDPLVGTLLAYTTFLRWVHFATDRWNYFRPLWRPHRSQDGACSHHFDHGYRHVFDRVSSDLCVGRDLGTRDAPILRIFQGIGIGGEWGGAVLMAVEHSPTGRRGFYGSWPQIGVPAGLLLSSGMVYLLSYLPEADFFAWGWRIAFLISAVLVAVGLYIRLKIMETPAFTRIQATKKVAHVPFFELLRTHGKNTLLGLGARYIEGVTFNIFGVFVVGYLAGTLGLPRQTALAGVMIASAIMIIMLPIYGNLSDKIGRRRMFAVAGVLIGLLSVPVLLADADQRAFPGLAGDRNPVRIRISGGLWPAGGIVFRAVRYACALHRNFVRLPILRNLRERTYADHCHSIVAGGRRQALADLPVCAVRQHRQRGFGHCDD
jgi:MFS family permease